MAARPNLADRERTATITVRMDGARTQRITVTQAGMIWNSVGENSNMVGVWPGSINVYTRTIGDVSPSFALQFPIWMDDARAEWGSALNVPIGRATSERNATIVAIGGSREEIERRIPLSSDAVGAGGAPRGRRLGRITAGGQRRNVYRLGGWLQGPGQVFVVDRSRNPNVHSNEMRTVVTHELGHALGYFGHSPNRRDVMYYAAHSSYRLKSIESKHLRQIYDGFR